MLANVRLERFNYIKVLEPTEDEYSYYDAGMDSPIEVINMVFKQG